MRLVLCIFSILVLAFPLGGCGAPKEEPTDTTEVTETPETEEVVSSDAELTLSIDGETVEVAWESNAAVEDLKTLAKEHPYEIKLSAYSDFEQVGPIGMSLTSNDEQMTTEPGDIVLYSGDQMVIFYGSNSWAYTKLGHITDKSEDELKDMLGKDNVTVSLSID